MFKLFSSLEYIYYKLLVTRSIAKLDIAGAGTDADQMHYVTLQNGFTFYGPETRGKEKKYYNLLPARIKGALPFCCFAIASDIIIRYIRGGLKLGGPAKETFYKVKPGDVAAEMGAYRGYFCMYMAEKIGPEGKVIAIEPLPDNLRFLQKNVEVNNLKNIHIVANGVWNKKDVLTFQRSAGDFQSSSIDLNYKNGLDYQMEVDTLDHIIPESGVARVDFMIIQLNGAELEALEGLNNILPDNIAIAARYKKEGVVAAKLIGKQLAEKGYTVKILKRDYLFAHKKDRS